MELTDAFNSKHRLIWPEWFLKHQKPLREQTSPYQEPIPRLTIEELEKETVTLIFEETNPRRLVYLLSTTYLLSAALDTAMEMGLQHCISNVPTPLYRIYDLCSDYQANYVNRLIHFLSQHKLFEYNENKSELWLGELGQALFAFSNSDDEIRQQFAEQCEIAHENSKFIVKGNPLQVIAALFFMKDFSKDLHQAAKLKLVDVLN